MAGITLQTVAKTESNPLRKGVIMQLLRYSSLLEKVPFESVSALKSVAVRATNLPSVGFRRINEGYTPSHGDVNQVWESVYGFGGEIEFDRVFEKIDNLIVKPKVLQTRLKLKAMALTFNDYFVNGDHATDEDGFEGLKKRISLMPSRQTVDMSSDTSQHDPTADAAHARRYLDKFEEAMYKAGGGIGGEAKIALMNEGQYWGFGRVLRFLSISGGPLLDLTKDQFGREQLTYKGAQFVDTGLKADQTTEVITDTEDPGDGGNDCTSIYFVPFSDEQGITGIQLGDMEVYDPLSGGERESKPTKLVRIDWWCGLAGFGSYGPTRLHSIENAAAWT